MNHIVKISWYISCLEAEMVSLESGKVLNQSTKSEADVQRLTPREAAADILFRKLEGTEPVRPLAMLSLEVFRLASLSRKAWRKCRTACRKVATHAVFNSGTCACTSLQICL